MTIKQPKKIIPKPHTTGRPKGSKNRRTHIREALQQHYPEGELGFWLSVAELARGGDIQAMTMIADRLYPKLKPQSEIVTLPPRKRLSGTASEQARQVIALVGEGIISPSIAHELLAAVNSMMNIETSQDLLERISALEELRP